MNGLFLQVLMEQGSFLMYFLKHSRYSKLWSNASCLRGEATAQVVRKFNLEVELIPDRSTGEDLAQALVATESLDSANVLVVTETGTERFWWDFLNQLVMQLLIH